MDIEMPSTVTGVGYLGNNHVQYADFTTTIWQDINNQNSIIAEDAIAKIISYIGNLVQMQYNNDESVASHLNLQNNVFLDYGISSNWVSYTNQTYYSDIIKENLLNNLPILVGAFQSMNDVTPKSWTV